MIQQLIGPFKANEELCTFGTIKHFSVQIKSLIPMTIIINNQEIEIGKTEIYELRDVEITSLKFKQDMDNNTIIEYVLKERI